MEIEKVKANSLYKTLAQPNGVAHITGDITISHLKVVMGIVGFLQNEIRMKLSPKIDWQNRYQNSAEIHYRIPINYKQLGILSNNKSNFIQTLEVLRTVSCVIPIQSKKVNLSRVIYHFTGLISAYEVEPGSEIIMLIVPGIVINRLLLVEEGYCSYDMPTALRFKSVYSLKLYWITCAWANKAGFRVRISRLREILGLDDSYKRSDHFKRILNTAKTEISNYTPFRIDYTIHDKEYVSFFIKKKVKDSGKKQGDIDNRMWNLIKMAGGTDTLGVRLHELVPPEWQEAFLTPFTEVAIKICNHKVNVRNVDKYIIGTAKNWLSYRGVNLETMREADG